MTITCTVTGAQLFRAANHGDTSTVRTLLSVEGAQSLINYQNAHGTTPLNMAARRGHAPVTELLIAARCNVDLPDLEGYTPLYNAAGGGHEVVAEKLMEAQCNLDLHSKNEETPLFMAIIDGNTAIAEKLIAARCNVDFEHNNAPTPLHLAAGIVPNVFNHQDVTETYGFVP
jgi:ankyrin repeat protein